MRFQCKKGPFSDMRTESCAQMLRMLRTGVDLELGLGLQPWGLGGQRHGSRPHSPQGRPPRRGGSNTGPAARGTSTNADASAASLRERLQEGEASTALSPALG